VDDGSIEVVSVPVMLSKDTMPDAIDVTPLPMEHDEDPQVKIKAYDHFLNSTMDLEQIAVLLEVPVASVKTWSRQGNWVSRRQDVMDVAMKESEQQMSAFIIKERQPTAERHLKVATKVEEAVDKTVDKLTKENDDGSMDPRLLKVLAEALSSSAGVSGKAVGITEMGIGGVDVAGGKKTPVVIINLSPTLSKQ
jgi:hypothetical protein